MKRLKNRFIIISILTTIFMLTMLFNFNPVQVKAACSHPSTVTYTVKNYNVIDSYHSSWSHIREFVVYEYEKTYCTVCDELLSNKRINTFFDKATAPMHYVYSTNEYCQGCNIVLCKIDYYACSFCSAVCYKPIPVNHNHAEDCPFR